MTQLHRSITPRTLHLQRRDTQEQTGNRPSANAVPAAGAHGVRAQAHTLRRVVVPLNAAAADDTHAGAHHGYPAPRAVSSDAASTSHGALLSANGGVNSENLLRGAKVVQILHNGESYQLRATRHGKLILTK